MGKFHHDEPQMCHKCSRLGPSSEFCFDEISDCPREKQDEALCCNSTGNHAAVSRSYPIWRQARSRRPAPTEETSPPAQPLSRPSTHREYQPPKENAWSRLLSSFVPLQVQRKEQRTPPKGLDVVLLPLTGKQHPLSSQISPSPKEAITPEMGE